MAIFSLYNQLTLGIIYLYEAWREIITVLLAARLRRVVSLRAVISNGLF